MYPDIGVHSDIRVYHPTVTRLLFLSPARDHGVVAALHVVQSARPVVVSLAVCAVPVMLASLIQPVVRLFRSRVRLMNVAAYDSDIRIMWRCSI